MHKLIITLALAAFILGGCSRSSNSNSDESSKDAFIFEGYIESVIVTSPNYYNTSCITITTKDGRILIAHVDKSSPKLLFEKGKYHRIHTVLSYGFWMIGKIEIFLDRSNGDSAYFELEKK